MPYSTIADLPDPVRGRYSPACQKVFLDAFNRSAERDMDEAACMKVAHTAAGMCKDAGKSTAVKFVDGSDSMIEGLAIPFGGPVAGKDLDGEDFGPDTDFAFDLYPHGRPLLYHHGLDGSVKLVAQGRQVEHEIRDEGIWARAQLDKSAKYHATVARLIAAGKLFFSSGSVSHLVETTKDGHIKRWPWTELSVTPTPANPWAAVYPVKMTDLLEHTRAAGIEVPGDLVVAALKALDDIPTDTDDALPDGAKFTDLIDRLSVDGPAWVKARQDWHAKSGRRLSAAMRERLADRPSTLRQLADDIDGLLHIADPAAEQKAIGLLYAAAVEQEARLQDVLRH